MAFQSECMSLGTHDMWTELRASLNWCSLQFSSVQFRHYTHPVSGRSVGWSIRPSIIPGTHTPTHTYRGTETIIMNVAIMFCNWIMCNWIFFALSLLLTIPCHVLDQPQTLVDCPHPTCSAHGYCADGTCICKKGWKGADCATMDKEALQCLPDCTGHGTFDLDTQTCSCEPKWSGDDCSKGTYMERT